MSSLDVPGNSPDCHHAAFMALESNDDDHAAEVLESTARSHFTLGHKQMSMKKAVVIDSTDIDGYGFSR